MKGRPLRGERPGGDLAGPPDEIEQGRHLVHERLVARLAALARHHLDQVLRVLGDRVAQAQQPRCPLLDRKDRPRRLRLPRARDDPPDLVVARHRDLREELSARRREGPDRVHRTLELAAFEGKLSHGLLGYREPVKTLVALSLLFFACAPGDGMRFQVIDMERPPEEVGVRPPADYQPCYTGEARGIDTNGDGKVDKITVAVNGKDRCYGEDTNHDGKIDTWDVLDESGNLTKRAHDANGDGRVDQAWTFDPARHGCATISPDRDGDGKPDPGSPIDICQGLANPPLPPAPPPR